MKEELKPVILSIEDLLECEDCEFYPDDTTKITEIKNMFEGVDVYIAKIAPPDFGPLYGQTGASYMFTISVIGEGMVAMDMPFAEKLTSEQYDSVKIEISKEYGEPDEIKNFAEGTITIWYPEDEERLTYALNPKSVTMFMKDDVVAVLNDYNLPIQIIDFINVVTNPPENVI